MRTTLKKKEGQDDQKKDKRRTKEGHLGPKEGHLEKEGQKKDAPHN